MQHYIQNYSESQIYRFLLQKSVHCNHLSRTSEVANILVLNCYWWHDGEWLWAVCELLFKIIEALPPVPSEWSCVLLVTFVV